MPVSKEQKTTFKAFISKKNRSHIFKLIESESTFNKTTLSEGLTKYSILNKVSSLHAVSHCLQVVANNSCTGKGININCCLNNFYTVNEFTVVALTFSSSTLQGGNIFFFSTY